MAGPSARPYRGVGAADRRAERRAKLLDAGLTILGTEAAPDALTVRGVCGLAGVSARYFYESFPDRDEFVGAVYDWVIADLTATTRAAVSPAPPSEQARAGMANIVRTIVGDPRVGRLMFSSQLADPVVVRKREESYALLAALFGEHVTQLLGRDQDERAKAASHFTVGGAGQTLSAWLRGQLALTPDELIDRLASLLDQITNPALYRG